MWGPGPLTGSRDALAAPKAAQPQDGLDPPPTFLPSLPWFLVLLPLKCRRKTTGEQLLFREFLAMDLRRQRASDLPAVLGPCATLQCSNTKKKGCDESRCISHTQPRATAREQRERISCVHLAARSNECLQDVPKKNDADSAVNRNLRIHRSASTAVPSWLSTEEPLTNHVTGAVNFPASSFLLDANCLCAGSRPNSKGYPPQARKRWQRRWITS